MSAPKTWFVKLGVKKSTTSKANSADSHTDNKVSRALTDSDARAEALEARSVSQCDPVCSACLLPQGGVVEGESCNGPSAEAKKDKVRFKFQAGFTNAIRRPVYLKDLL